MIRIAFISDQSLCALGVRMLLSDQEGVDLVGKFNSKERPSPFFSILTN
jgi:hypothetical protein